MMTDPSLADPPPGKQRTTITLPEDVHRYLDDVAHARRVSLNKVVGEICTEAVERMRAEGADRG